MFSHFMATSQLPQMKSAAICAGTCIWQSQERQRTGDTYKVQLRSRSRFQQPLIINSCASAPHYTHRLMPNVETQQKERAETVAHAGSCQDFDDREEETLAPSRRKAVWGGHNCSLTDFAPYILGGEYEGESCHLTWRTVPLRL
jgi:hypothetical protein